MAYDKVVDSAQLDAKLTAVANPIRSIIGSTAKLGLEAMATELNGAATEVGSQTDLIAEIMTALEGKVAGGGGGEYFWKDIVFAEDVSTPYEIDCSDVPFDITEYDHHYIFLRTSDGGSEIYLQRGLSITCRFSKKNGYAGKFSATGVSIGTNSVGTTKYSAASITPNAHSKKITIGFTGTDNSFVKASNEFRLIIVKAEELQWWK